MAGLWLPQGATWTPKGDLRAVTHSDPAVSSLYRAAVGLNLADIIAHAYGGPPGDLNLWPEVIVANTPASHVRRRIADFAHGLTLQHGPKLRPGDSLRAFQVANTRTWGEVRVNQAVQGDLCALIEPCPGSEHKLRVTLAFARHSNDPPDASIYTVLLGLKDGSLAALAFCDAIPSVIRSGSWQDVKSMVSRGLPPAARPRWRRRAAELEKGQETEAFRASLHLAYQNRHPTQRDTVGIMRRGLAAQVLEEVERHSTEGLPGRRSPVRVEFGDLPEEAVGSMTTELEHGGLDFESLTNGLSARHQEVLHRFYVQGETQAQIAASLGLTQPRVSQMLNSARVTLRKRLQSD